MAAARAYRDIRGRAAPDMRFAWDGVIDRRRIDSFFDPFGNLTVADRALLEEARTLAFLGRDLDAHGLLDQLSGRLTPMQAAQLDAYWQRLLEEGNAP